MPVEQPGLFDRGWMRSALSAAYERFNNRQLLFEFGVPLRLTSKYLSRVFLVVTTPCRREVLTGSLFIGALPFAYPLIVARALPLSVLRSGCFARFTSATKIPVHVVRSVRCHGRIIYWTVLERV